MTKVETQNLKSTEDFVRQVLSKDLNQHASTAQIKVAAAKVARVIPTAPAASKAST